jgi:hypothetical protein
LRSNDEIALQPVSISHHGRYDQTIALKFKVFYLRPLILVLKEKCNLYASSDEEFLSLF